MTKRKGKGTPTVTFRSGPLLPLLQARGSSAGGVAGRDLRRYYDLLATTLANITLTPAEGRLLTDLDVDDLTDPRLLWATTADAIRDHGLAESHVITDPTAFIERLRALGPAESLALVDALERFRVARVDAVGRLEVLMRDLLPITDA